jgi:peptidoglycan lytic transglycosylase F
MRSLPRPLTLTLQWLLLLSLLPVSTCSPKPSALSRIKATGRLTVAATNSPTTCYEGPSGPTGYECDLLVGLAHKLGVSLDLQFVDSAPAAVAAVEAGRADLAAAGINITPAWKQRVRFTRPLQQVVQQLVYFHGGGDETPASPADLDGTLTVVAGSSAEAQLAELKQRYPDLSWSRADPDDDAEDLLYRVAKGKLDYTVANSDLVALDRRFYPQIHVAFAVSDTQDLAWALRQDRDSNALYRAVEGYLDGLGDTELARLRDRYFGEIEAGGYEGVVHFTADVQVRLPRYRPVFEAAARQYGLDWRMLAAVGYEESHWDPAAISPTGVHGIMQLTMDTAQQMAVDRDVPAQSIRGGARYLRELLTELPPQIAEPDRTWMALAAYNQGIGHLLDARDLAAQLGGDPDRWLDVRNALPLLSRESWFKHMHYGYAAGREIAGYVSNVRNYYDMLTWLTGNPNALPQLEPQPATLPIHASRIPAPAGADIKTAIRSSSAQPLGH